MKILFHPLAKAELEEAVTFYEHQDEGLGKILLNEIKGSLKQIKQFPEAWSKTFLECRRCLANHFPYGIIYRIEADFITVFAVMHLKKNPSFWLKRIRKNG